MMMPLSDLSHPELAALHEEQAAAYNTLLSKGLKLDLTRGKPSAEQLDLSNELLTLPGEDTYMDSTGTDCRNYGGLQGLPAIRTIFAPLLNVPVDQLVGGDNSSLSIMHDALVYALLKGTVDSAEPWSKTPIKFICPVPGYDRHFALCEQFGIEMISVPLSETGPDLDRCGSWLPTIRRSRACGLCRCIQIPPARSIARKSPAHCWRCRRRGTSECSGTTRTRCIT